MVAGMLAVAPGGAARAPLKTGVLPSYAQACRGAGATAPGIHCERTRAVTPTPADALLTPNVVCTSPAEGSAQFEQCTYGVPADQAVATVGVVGDSHAAQWRAAIALVAQARRWHVVELARPHCPFTLIPTTQAFAAFCVPYNQELLVYLAQHPEISTIYVSVNHFVNMVTTPGQTKQQAKLAGHLAAFRALPASVEHVIVIRDNPQQPIETPDCVDAAMAAGRFAGPSCKIPRARALRTDYEDQAARMLGAPRFSVLNLTRRFCDRHDCFPVLGGVLVHKDTDHLGQLYVKTLAPFLLAFTNQVVPTESGAPAVSTLPAD